MPPTTRKSISVPTNCAPAISRDGKTIYIAVADDNTGRGILLGVDSKTLKTKYSAALTDPYFKQPALVFDVSSASPTIGPDGDVYYGVVESDGATHNDRGWLLHFDAKLKKSEKFRDRSDGTIRFRSFPAAPCPPIRARPATC